MDRSGVGNGENFVENFVPRDDSANRSSFPHASTSGRHSKPRMVKIRRGAGRVRSAVIDEDCGGSEFNPFRSRRNRDANVDVSSSSVVGDGVGVSESAHSSSGLARKCVEDSDNDSCAISREETESVRSGVGGFDSGAFVFGAGAGTCFVNVNRSSSGLIENSCLAGKCVEDLRGVSSGVDNHSRAMSQEKTESVNNCVGDLDSVAFVFGNVNNSCADSFVFRAVAETGLYKGSVENTDSASKPVVNSGSFVSGVCAGMGSSSSSSPRLDTSEDLGFVFSSIPVSGSVTANTGCGGVNNDTKFSSNPVGNVDKPGLSSFHPLKSSGSVFGTASIGKSSLSEEATRNSGAGNFHFGNNAASSSFLSQDSFSVTSDHGSFSRHPDGIQNLNSGTITSNVEVLSDKPKKSDHEGREAADFVLNFSDSKYGPSSIGAAAGGTDSQLEGIHNLNTAELKNMKNVGVEDTTKMFVFRSNLDNINTSKSSSTSSTYFDETLKKSVDLDHQFKDVATPSSELHFLGHGSSFATTNFKFTFKNKVKEAHASGLTTGVSVFSNVNSYIEPQKGAPSGMRTSGAKIARKKKGKDKRKPPTLSHVFPQSFTSIETGNETIELDSPSSYYSAMDYSPKEEHLVPYQSSREASVASDDSDFFQEASTDAKRLGTEYDAGNLVCATQQLKVAEDSTRDGNINNGSSEYLGEMNFSATSCQPNESDNYRESSILNGNPESSDGSFLETETGADPSKPKLEKQVNNWETIFAFSSKPDDNSKLNFAYGASPFPQGSASKQHQRGKNRIRGGQLLNIPAPSNALVSSPSPMHVPISRFSMQHNPADDCKGSSYVLQGSHKEKSEKDAKLEIKKDNVPSEVQIAAHEICERWRLRGNEAYAKGYIVKAEECYSRGVNSIPHTETSASCKALPLCYSNRAAARISLGRIADALSDCMMAIAIDPKFLRAQLRAANCYLALGEVDDALEHFKKCLQSESDGNLDQKILMEASDGLRKAQQLARCFTHSKELLLKRTYSDAEKSLQIISEALLISPYSEYLLQGKATALLRLRKYYEVIEFCQKNPSTKKMDGSEELESFPTKSWRWHIMSKSYFYLGKLDEALELLRQLEQEKLCANKDTSSESSTGLFVTITELVRLKTAGNEAFQEGKHLEAVEYYTAALACNSESPHFAAICFCNRAAAFQALGQIIDAIADCSLAIALDGNYSKALSRRATLYEMIRDYGQAANDLRRLISILENQHTDKDDPSGIPGRPVNTSVELNRFRARLSTVEEEARNEVPLDIYVILGINPSCSAADVKKAYRKSALRHHPDKAGQFLARNENIDDELWKEVLDEVHKDADRLFKIIGEAYSVLSDSTKRLQYDADEEMRTIRKKAYSMSSTSKTPAENYSSQFDKGINSHHWRAYESTYRRYSESSRSNR